jgi:signal transduction histidine kinase
MTRIRNLDQMKSNFISLAGHELRTPLTVITAFNEMILNGEMGRIPESMQEATQSIQERLTDLNRKVTNILEITQFEEGLSVLQLQPVNVTDVVHELVQERRALLQPRSLHLAVRAPEQAVYVTADRDYLLHALQQLLDNAIRFTADDGLVSVELAQSDDNVSIAIRDTGIGIEPEQQRWIFEKAWETSDLMHHTSGHLEFGSRGLGLGLALARNIVRAHDGEISLQSQMGHGSCFTVVLAAVSDCLETPQTALAMA